jgi:hypothetical protein
MKMTGGEGQPDYPRHSPANEQAKQNGDNRRHDDGL